MKNLTQNLGLWMSMLLLSVMFSTAEAGKTPPLASDLQALVTEANALNTQVGGINLTAENMCSELRAAHDAAAALISNIEAVDAGLAAPISVDADSLQALDDLSASFVSLGSISTNLSQAIATLNLTTDMFAISNGMTAMLRLSDDIGIMADRIGEMADKILIMADNIGLMADRIITTQQIQSANLAMTQSFLLQTQQNLLAMVSVVNSNTYEADFNAQTVTGNFIAMDIGTTVLNMFNMAREFAGIASDVDGLKAQVEATHQAIVDAAKLNTVYVDTDSLAALANMSVMVSSVSIALQGLSLAAEGLSPITGDVTLANSMNSMLQLSSDIGIMADRILEMGDLILAMADNIGLTADQIIATQQLQNANYGATLASVEAIQSIAVSVISVQNL